MDKCSANNILPNTQTHTHTHTHTQGYWKPENDTNQYHVAIKVLKNTSAQANKELLRVRDICMMSSNVCISHYVLVSV